MIIQTTSGGRELESFRRATYFRSNTQSTAFVRSTVTHKLVAHGCRAAVVDVTIMPNAIDRAD